MAEALRITSIESATVAEGQASVADTARTAALGAETAALEADTVAQDANNVSKGLAARLGGLLGSAGSALGSAGSAIAGAAGAAAPFALPVAAIAGGVAAALIVDSHKTPQQRAREATQGAIFQARGLGGRAGVAPGATALTPADLAAIQKAQATAKVQAVPEVHVHLHLDNTAVIDSGNQAALKKLADHLMLPLGQQFKSALAGGQIG